MQVKTQLQYIIFAFSKLFNEILGKKVRSEISIMIFINSKISQDVEF